MNKQDSRTVLITISTLLGLFFAYCLFLYIKSAITLREIDPKGYAYTMKSSKQNSLSWNIDKLAFATVCLLKGGTALKYLNLTDNEIICERYE